MGTSIPFMGASSPSWAAIFPLGSRHIGVPLHGGHLPLTWVQWVLAARQKTCIFPLWIFVTSSPTWALYLPLHFGTSWAAISWAGSRPRGLHWGSSSPDMGAVSASRFMGAKLPLHAHWILGRFCLTWTFISFHFGEALGLANLGHFGFLRASFPFILAHLGPSFLFILEHLGPSFPVLVVQISRHATRTAHTSCQERSVSKSQIYNDIESSPGLGCVLQFQVPLDFAFWAFISFQNMKLLKQEKNEHEFCTFGRNFLSDFAFRL